LRRIGDDGAAPSSYEAPDLRVVHPGAVGLVRSSARR